MFQFLIPATLLIYLIVDFLDVEDDYREAKKMLRLLVLILLFVGQALSCPDHNVSRVQKQSTAKIFKKLHVHFKKNNTISQDTMETIFSMSLKKDFEAGRNKIFRMLKTHGIVLEEGIWKRGKNFIPIDTVEIVSLLKIID